MVTSEYDVLLFLMGAWSLGRCSGFNVYHDLGIAAFWLGFMVIYLLGEYPRWQCLLRIPYHVCALAQACSAVQFQSLSLTWWMPRTKAVGFMPKINDELLPFDLAGRSQFTKLTVGLGHSPNVLPSLSHEAAGRPFVACFGLTWPVHLVCQPSSEGFQNCLDLVSLS